MDRRAPSATFSLLKFVRTLVGLILAPIAGGVSVMTASYLYGLAGEIVSHGWPTGLLRNFETALVIGFEGGAMLGIAPALILGWPIHLLLLSKRLGHVAVYVGLAAGVAIAGFYVMSPIILGPIWGNTSDMTLDLIAIIGAAGAVGAAVFWFIRRPDRDFASTNEASMPQSQ